MKWPCEEGGGRRGGERGKKWGEETVEGEKEGRGREGRERRGGEEGKEQRVSHIYLRGLERHTFSDSG